MWTAHSLIAKGCFLGLLLMGLAFAQPASGATRANDLDGEQLPDCSGLPDGTLCDDGDACTQGDTCSGGMCVGGPPPNCDDGNACTDDICDPTTGCVFVFRDCNDGNACTADGCEPAGGCFHVDTTASCNDGNVCNGEETCDPSSGCQAGPVLDCNDSNVCTDDTCDSSAGCVNTPNTAPCDDGDACTTGDMCTGGACLGGPPLNCDDGNVCTLDSCNMQTGCENPPVPDAVPCEDGNACTTGDTCQNGTCTSGVQTICDDGVFCNGEEKCDPSSGACHSGTPPNCDDGDVCTADSCNEITDQCDHSDACGAGMVTGGGKVVTVTGGEASFGHIAQRKVASNSPTASGHFDYNEPGGLHVNGPVDTLIITGPNSATFSGTCGPGCTFTVNMKDNSEPNQDPNRDELEVTVNLVPRNPATPKVIKGNNQFHKPPP